MDILSSFFSFYFTLYYKCVVRVRLVITILIIRAFRTGKVSAIKKKITSEEKRSKRMVLLLYSIIPIPVLDSILYRERERKTTLL